eukprot:366026-Chlamydomonas_euryale.AAC.9
MEKRGASWSSGLKGRGAEVPPINSAQAAASALPPYPPKIANHALRQPPPPRGPGRRGRVACRCARSKGEAKCGAHLPGFRSQPLQQRRGGPSSSASAPPLANVRCAPAESGSHALAIVNQPRRRPPPSRGLVPGRAAALGITRRGDRCGNARAPPTPHPLGGALCLARVPGQRYVTAAAELLLPPSQTHAPAPDSPVAGSRNVVCGVGAAAGRAPRGVDGGGGGGEEEHSASLPPAGFPAPSVRLKRSAASPQAGPPTRTIQLRRAAPAPPPASWI